MLMGMAENPAKPATGQRYTVTREGATFGPYGIDELKALASQGRLRPTDQAWTEGNHLPTTVGALLLAPQDGRDVTEGVIPYKNPAALLSYYIGLASITPVLGIVTGIAAVVLGIRGLLRYQREPWRRGRIHSYAGICFGALTSLTWLIMSIIAAYLWLHGRLKWK